MARVLTPEEEALFEQLKAGVPPEQHNELYQQVLNLGNLPEDQRLEAMRQLSQDYEGREKTLRDELETNYALLTQEGPQGGMAGNNPFSVYVAANPLEHLASGMQKYGAGRDIRAGRDKLEALSKDKEEGLSTVMQGLQAEIMRQQQEEEERKKRLAMAGAGGFQMPGKVY